MLLFYLSLLSKDAPVVFVFSFLLYVFGSVTNPLQQLLTIPSVFCYLFSSFFKNNRAFYTNFDFCFEKRLFLKYFKNNFKILYEYVVIWIICGYMNNIWICGSHNWKNASVQIYYICTHLLVFSLVFNQVFVFHVFAYIS